MTSSVRAFRELAGDALIAVGELVRGRKVRFAGVEPADWDVTYQRHTDRDGWTAPAIAPAEVRSALDELPDSTLIFIAATVIAGWKPILLSSAAAAMTDVDLLIDTLRDRATQFRVVEADADRPFPNTAQDLLDSIERDRK